MSDERGPVELLDDRPELEPAVAAVLAVDDERDGWTFDDVDIDSGAFGELVSHGVVEKNGGEYVLADRAAVRRALDGEPTEGTADAGQRFDFDGLSLPDVDGRAIGLLAAALSAVVLTRAYVLGSVYRGGDIVLSGNDPYYYRYWVERVATEAGGGADFAALSTLPSTVTRGEPLMVATLWWVAELLGGTTETIGHVLAWFPVVSAVISGALVYLLAVRVTSDRRVGLASVLFLAIIPGHALRTSLGYADHHAFDYPWLGLTALGLLLAMTASRDAGSLRAPVPWAAGAAVGVSIAGQTLSWEAGPLLLVPIGIAVGGKTLLDVEAGRSPLLTNTPIIAGTGLGAALVWLVHTNWKWHTELVASTPFLLFLGVCGVVATAAVVARAGGTARQLAAVDGVVFVVGLLTVRSLFTERWDEAFSRTDRLFRSDAIAETAGLFDPGTLGFLLLFGFALVMALPAMAWGVRLAARDRAGWLVVTAYAWYFLALAAVQVRFVGELATFAAVFAGYAFVWLATRVEVARPLVPDPDGITDALVPEPRMLGLLCVLFLLFGSLGLVQVPVKTGQVTTDSGQYQTATAIERDAVDHGLEYPQSYVLSQWGQNRAYNYFVNGESRSYAYARNTYGEFLGGTNGSAWYERLRGRVGYVVTEDGVEAGPETLQSRLHTGYGSQSESGAGLAHYQAVYATESGGHKAFALVPGATLTGTAGANATVTATATVALPNGEFEYVRQTRAGPDGSYRLVVANPGTYTVGSASSTATMSVNESAVRNGTRLAVDA